MVRERASTSDAHRSFRARNVKAVKEASPVDVWTRYIIARVCARRGSK